MTSSKLQLHDRCSCHPDDGSASDGRNGSRTASHKRSRFRSLKSRAARAPNRTATQAALLFIAAFASIVATGCHPANSARGVVDRFIDQYYVAIDLKAAEPFCTGLALDKLHHEMTLIGNQKIDENTRKPVVHYKLTAERDATDHIEFLFRATIDVPEGGTFNRNWLITARKDADTWKVSNFDDYE
jgi:hypothetical protein